MLEDQHQADAEQQPEDRGGGEQEERRRALRLDRHQRRRRDARLGDLQALLLARLLGAVEKRLVERAIRLGLALELVQPDVRLGLQIGARPQGRELRSSAASRLFATW